MNAWGHTPNLGNKVWLLGVDVWFRPTVVNGFMMLQLDLTAGWIEETNPLNIRDQWEPVMQNCYGPANTMLLHGTDIHLHFDMNKLYKEDKRRFGAVAAIIDAGVECHGLIAWHISEG